MGKSTFLIFYPMGTSPFIQKILSPIRQERIHLSPGRHPLRPGRIPDRPWFPGSGPPRRTSVHFHRERRKTWWAPLKDRRKPHRKHILGEGRTQTAGNLLPCPAAYLRPPPLPGNPGPKVVQETLRHSNITNAARQGRPGRFR